LAVFRVCINFDTGAICGVIRHNRPSSPLSSEGTSLPPPGSQPCRKRPASTKSLASSDGKDHSSRLLSPPARLRKMRDPFNDLISLHGTITVGRRSQSAIGGSKIPLVFNQTNPFLHIMSGACVFANLTMDSLLYYIIQIFKYRKSDQKASLSRHCPLTQSQDQPN
jgi:hypothetical protein